MAQHGKKKKKKKNVLAVFEDWKPRVAQERLLGWLALLDLAANVVEGEKHVVGLGEVEGDGDLDLLVKRGRLAVKVDGGPGLGHKHLGRGLAKDGLDGVASRRLVALGAWDKLHLDGNVARRRLALVLGHVERGRVHVERVDVVDLGAHDQVLRELFHLTDNLVTVV